MASANLLSDDELTFIKGMLDLQPQPFDQVILSYFSRPGRDINHRVIREIRHGGRGVPSGSCRSNLQTFLSQS